MAAYYNEIDPYAAEWLRNLIREGHIAPGEVDERDIRDVRPVDLIGFDQCHFFAGIGGWSLALRMAGWPDDRPVWTGSCPCQPFSAAGARAGFADERHLWPAWFWLIEQHRPGVIFGEQVASKHGLAWLDLVHADLEAAGYAVGAVDLCAAGVGAPHIRQRLWFVAEANSNRAPSARESAGGSRKSIGTGHFPSGRGPCRLAESGGERRERVGLHVQPGAARLDLAEARGCGEVGRVAESDRRQRNGIAGGEGRKPDGTATGRHESDGEPERGRAVGELGNPGRAGSRRDTRAVLGAQGEAGRCVRCVADEPELAGTTCDVGHSDDARPQGRCLPEADRGRHGAGERLARPPGPVNGFWSDADWLPCRDGKARPVEPGTFPLAHGVPNRVGRLRAYGNAIVAQAAAEFIRAYMT